VFKKKGNIHKAAGNGTAFTPPVTVVVDAADKSVLFGQLQKLFFLHLLCGLCDFAVKGFLDKGAILYSVRGSFALGSRLHLLRIFPTHRA